MVTFQPDVSHCAGHFVPAHNVCPPPPSALYHWQLQSALSQVEAALAERARPPVKEPAAPHLGPDHGSGTEGAKRSLDNLLPRVRPVPALPLSSVSQGVADEGDVAPGPHEVYAAVNSQNLK